MAAADAQTWYAEAASDLDEHLAGCPSCSAGRACTTGDLLADDEYRMGTDLLAAQGRGGRG